MLSGLVALAACGSAQKAPTSDGGSDAAPPPARAGCTTDADCRTYASYCTDAPCACRVFAKGEADPACTGQVACVVDPCMKKAAACQGGKCQLVVGAGGE